MKTLPKYLLVHMPDQSVWSVPVDMIARHRARYYAHEFDGDIERSLQEDTLPLFADDHFEIFDWASNNMNWEDVASSANMIREGGCNFEKGWVNGNKELI